jgi:hypothetical protein
VSGRFSKWLYLDCDINTSQLAVLYLLLVSIIVKKICQALVLTNMQPDGLILHELLYIPTFASVKVSEGELAARILLGNSCTVSLIEK